LEKEGERKGGREERGEYGFEQLDDMRRDVI